MLIIDFFLFGNILVETGNYYVYKSSTPENIEFCASALHNPLLQETFKKECNLEKTNQYILSIKNSSN